MAPLSPSASFRPREGRSRSRRDRCFPALHRLEQDGWIEGEWETPPKGRRIKSYRLTREGRRHLSAEKATWQRVVTAMSLVLESSS